MQDFLLEQGLLDPNLKLLWTTEAIAHGRKADIKSKANHELAVADIAASLDDVLWLNFESSRVIDLLEVASEVSLVVVLPFDQAANLVRKL